MLRREIHRRSLFGLLHASLIYALLTGWGGCLWTQEPRWPQTRTNAGGVLVMYQPQVDDWKNFQVVDSRMAFTIAPTGGKEHPGVATIRMQTSVDMDTHIVTLTNPQITSLYFPSLDPATTAQMDQLVRSFLNPAAVLTMSVDHLAASVKKKDPPKTVQLKNDPPVIFISFRPAILLMVNGTPVEAAVGQSNIKAVVNANWPLFLDQTTSTYYLFDGKGWLKGPNLENWEATSYLPADLSQVTLSPNWSDLQPYIPPPLGSTSVVPAVYYSSKPAEVVIFNGRPEWMSIPGTQLTYPANTDSTILRYTPTNTFYFLASGRWFSATSPLGPWTFATNDLPPDFQRVPPDNPAGKVLAFVPGTPEAEDAVLLAQIPTTATVNVAEAAKKVQVSYAGQPQFEPIQGTSMYYAVNTPNRVIQVGSQYYLCYQGLWFYAGTPNGPWVVAQTVPQVIYTIPPSSPVYNVTYVTQVQSSPGYVSASYTAGYLGTFVAGMAVGAICAGGTGWYYPPYAYGGYYYPYAATYGYHTAYNPYTGAYGYGGSAYGPYGSAHWGTSYNPNTGTYARGAEESTPYGTRAQGEAYNPYTGASAATRQGSNAYGSWGQSVYNKNGETAYTQHASNAYGSVGTAQTSSGGKAAASSTAYGNTAVGKTSSGDMYADHNGNVYQNTGSGWQKYDNGSWNDVNKTTAQQTYNQSHPNSSYPGSSNQEHPQNYQQSGSRPSGTSSYGDLDQEAQNRSRGDTQSQRFSNYQHSSGWGGSSSRFGGGSSGWGGDRWGGGGAAGRSWGGRR
ncbi:MAG TPA: hypothetical protein VL240_04295 [Candidatus Binatia bacterium]|nr:hypothetical protein [Candidatus Binatia bacterium]